MTHLAPLFMLFSALTPANRWRCLHAKLRNSPAHFCHDFVLSGARLLKTNSATDRRSSESTSNQALPAAEEPFSIACHSWDLCLFRYSRATRHCLLFKSPLQDVGHEFALRLPDTKSVRSVPVHVAGTNHRTELHRRGAKGGGR